MRIAAEAIWFGSGPVRPGTLRVDRGVITVVEEAFDPAADHVYREAIITPGLVNAHAHLDLTFSRTSDRSHRSFTEWLLSIRDLRESEGASGLSEAARRGIEQALASGTTTVVDYDATGASLEPLAESPMRRVLLREVICFTADFDRLRAALATFLTPEPDEREVRGLAPHAPYTVQERVLRGCLELARSLDRPWSMHVCEQPWELDLMLEWQGAGAEWLESLGVDRVQFGCPKASPIDYLGRVGALADRPLLVHANYLDTDELTYLASSGATVVFCPRSHAFFGHTPHPLPELMAHGIPVCLGTDGMVSSGPLSMLDEMASARRAFPELRADTLFRMATSVSHRALGGAFGLGTLEPGQPADLAVWSNALTLEGVLRGGRCLATHIAGERVHEAIG